MGFVAKSLAPLGVDVDVSPDSGFIPKYECPIQFECVYVNSVKKNISLEVASGSYTDTVLFHIVQCPLFWD